MTSTERARNPRGRGALLRDEILAAADRVLAGTADEASVSLRAIAREAGIAAPSIYEHFANKHEILQELLRRDYADLVSRLRSAAADAPPGPDGVGGALAAARAFSAFARDEPGRYRLMFEFRQEPVDVADLAEHPVQGVLAAFADAAAPSPAATSGHLSPRELAVALLSALHGQIVLWRTLPLPPELRTFAEGRERLVLALLGHR